jgi:dihydroneopterin aldolase
MNKDKIILKNMAFYGYHGVLAEESSLGQKFFVDATLYLDTQIAGIKDDLDSSVSYAEVYEIIKDVVENKRYKLLEALAENLTISVFEKFERIQSMKVQIKKPEAPVPGIYDYFAVEIERQRHG